MLQLTCTCASRYVKDAEHESDCDLWLIDEFWAGFLAWDWDREILVPTDRYPDRDNHSDYVESISSMQYLDDYDDELSEHDLVQLKLEEMDARDRDVALTTDLFIERMMGKEKDDEELTWTKGDDGLWRSEAGKSVNLPGGTTYTSKSTYITSDGSWGMDGYDWTSFGSDRHCETKITFKNGVVVQATSLSKDRERKGDDPDFGLYLDMGWTPRGVAIMLPWQDYGLPNVSFGMARYAIEEAYAWAESGGVVEVGCIGAHGRTGTALACMAVLADVDLTGPEAVKWIRTNFCKHAIETREQEWFVEWFYAQVHGTEAPPRPSYVPRKVTTVVTASPKAQASPAGSPPAAGRTGKARRSRRGGKRNRARSFSR